MRDRITDIGCFAVQERIAEIRRKPAASSRKHAAIAADSLTIVPHDTGHLGPHRNSLPRECLSDVPSAAEDDELVVAHGCLL